MATTIHKDKSVPPAASLAPVSVIHAHDPVAEPQATSNVNLELVRMDRYFYRSMLYEKGQVYVFTPDSANQILGLTDPQGLPVFMPAKPRTKLVQIPVETATVAVRDVVDGQPITFGVPLKPVGMLELDDGNDPETAERLRRIDAELIDTGASRAVEV